MVSATQTYNINYFLGTLVYERTPELATISQGRIKDSEEKSLALKVLDETKRDENLTNGRLLGWLDPCIIPNEKTAQKVVESLRQFRDAYPSRIKREIEVEEGFIYIRCDILRPINWTASLIFS